MASCIAGQQTRYCGDEYRPPHAVICAGCCYIPGVCIIGTSVPSELHMRMAGTGSSLCLILVPAHSASRCRDPAGHAGVLRMPIAAVEPAISKPDSNLSNA